MLDEGRNGPEPVVKLDESGRTAKVSLEGEVFVFSEGESEGAKEGGNRLKVNGSDPNCLSGEFVIDKGNAADVGGGLRQFRPENGIDSQYHPREAVIAKKGLQPSNPLKLSTDTPRERRLSAEETERVKRLIAKGMSPDWARAEVLGEEAS